MNLPKPIPRAPEIDWEDYLNQRILWNIDWSNFGVTLNASVVVCKHDKDLILYIEVDSTSVSTFQISATTFDKDNKKLKSCIICGYNYYEGFSIEQNVLPYRRLADIDRIEIDGTYFEHNV